MLLLCCPLLLLLLLLLLQRVFSLFIDMQTYKLSD
jgi:hypothetical protein